MVLSCRLSNDTYIYAAGSVEDPFGSVDPFYSIEIWWENSITVFDWTWNFGDLTTHKGFTLISEPATGVVSVKLDKVSLNNEGEYRCRISKENVLDVEAAFSQLTVHGKRFFS